MLWHLSFSLTSLGVNDDSIAGRVHASSLKVCANELGISKMTQGKVDRGHWV